MGDQNHMQAIRRFAHLSIVVGIFFVSITSFATPGIECSDSLLNSRAELNRKYKIALTVEQAHKIGPSLTEKLLSPDNAINHKPVYAVFLYENLFTYMSGLSTLR